MSDGQRNDVRYRHMWWVCLSAFIMMMIACDNPCKQLAQRICDCEPTRTQRQTCEQFRIIDRDSDAVDPTEAEEDFCIQKLESCTCAALDQNRTDLCGFSNGAAPQQLAGSND